MSDLNSGRLWRLAGVFVCLLALVPRVHCAEVLTSIKPLALIAAELVAEDDRVDYLLPAGVSPHAYAMRVSDMRKLQSAELVVWIGPELENFLQKPLAQRGLASVLTSMDLAGLDWPEPSDHDHGDHGHDRDPHVWLNPGNALIVAGAISQALAELEPEKAPLYKKRLQSFQAQVVQLDEELSSQLAAVQQEGFAVYHDGYGHFVEHYNLRQIDFVSLTPEQRPGARHLAHLEKSLGTDARCLFSEPYGSGKDVQTLAERLNMRSGVLDPLASDTAVTSYEQLMRQLAASLSACLVGEDG